MILNKLNIPFITLACCLFYLQACNNHKSIEQEDVTQTVRYTCPMHPQVITHQPGTCPICKMDLVSVKNSSTKASITLTENQIQLANITTIKVGTGNFTTSKVLNGRLMTNPGQTELISSRMAGRVEKLYVKETGRALSLGEPILEIYSEQLQVLQQDYLLQLKQVSAFPGEKIYRSLAEAARRKLMLFGYSNAQINSLSKSNKPSPNITIYATKVGVVQEISVSEGQYLEEGSPILRLENFNQLWVETDVYPNEINQVTVGSTIKVLINGSENEPQTAKIDFVSPALNASTQRLTMRATINNSSGKFQPGMQATVLLSTGKASKAFSLPLGAVIRDENGSHVWIKTKGNTFTSRKVLTGDEDANQVVITSGISDGEEIVSTGAFLLNSEFILKNENNL